jgi:hypothetical protein
VDEAENRTAAWRDSLSGAADCVDSSWDDTAPAGQCGSGRHSRATTPTFEQAQEIPSKASPSAGLLGDYTGSIALFLDHRFVSLISTVHSAYRSHSGIDVAHCKAFRNKDDEVLLMPTDRSVVSIIERLVEHCPLSSEQSQNASQEETTITHGVAKRRQQTQVTCTIRDMVVQGVSLAGQKQTYLVDDNVERLHALLCLDQLRYKDVLLVLEEVSTGTTYSTVATTNVIEKLLGDTPVDSWKSNINLQRIVVRLIRGVLEDNVRLSWTIEQQISVGASSREPRQQSFVADVELALF